MRLRSILPTVAGMLVLAGCTPAHRAPAVAPIPPAALGLSDGPAAPAIAPDWWRSFGDPQLDRLVAAALDGNPSLDAALARIAQARATLATQRAETGPQATLDAQGQVSRLSGRYTIPPPFAGTTRFVGTGLANLDWNLDLFGRQRSAIRAARAAAEAAALDLAAARLTLSGAMVSAYLDLAAAERQRALALRTIAARSDSLRLVDVRIRNRLASQLDRQAAATLVDDARQALVRADAGAVLARNAIAAIAGRGSDFAATIAPVAVRGDDALALPATIPADLLARRPDIAAARARIDAAAAGRQAAERAFYPNINLAAFAGFQAVGIGNLFTLDAATAGAGPALHLPIFDRGRRRAELEGATAALDLATADYNSRVVGAVREAADAIAQIAAFSAERQNQRRLVAGYAETGRLNAVRVASGLDSRLDLIDNDVRLLAAEQADADLAIAIDQSRVRLVLALGGGFSLPQEPTR